MPTIYLVSSLQYARCLGNLLCSTINHRKVIVFTQSGQAIRSTNMTSPRYFSVSTADNTIYVADWTNGVYESRDDGLTWCRVFKTPMCASLQTAKVSSSAQDSPNTDDFWTLEICRENITWRLRVYTVDKRRPINDSVALTWSDVSLPSEPPVSLMYSRLAYDGRRNILVTDSMNSAVHVWLVSGQYDRQLVSKQHFAINSVPVRVALEYKKDGEVTMYVSQRPFGLISVFRLTYANVE